MYTKCQTVLKVDLLVNYLWTLLFGKLDARRGLLLTPVKASSFCRTLCGSLSSLKRSLALSPGGYGVDGGRWESLWGDLQGFPHLRSQNKRANHWLGKPWLEIAEAVESLGFKRLSHVCMWIWLGCEEGDTSEKSSWKNTSFLPGGWF